MNPFSNKALVAILAVGLSTFALGLVLAAFSPDVFGQSSPGNDSYSRSLIGHRALTEFLKRSGLAVVISRNADWHRANRAFPLLLLEPEGSIETSLEDLLEGGGNNAPHGLDRYTRLSELIAGARSSNATVIVALPKWTARPSRMKPGWISHQNLIPPKTVERLLGEVIQAADRPREDVELQGEQATSELKVVRASSPEHPRAEELGLPAPAIDLGDQVQLIGHHPDIEPLVDTAEGVLIGRLPNGLIAISDPDLFNNRGLGRADHAALVHGLLADVLGAEGVVVDETLHGFTSGESLLGRALSFPLVVVSVHALLAMFLTAWAVSGRFGKALSPPPALPPGKQLLMDNTSRLLLAGGEHADALHRYLRVTLSRLARRFAVSGATDVGKKGFVIERDLVPQLQALSDARGVSIDLAGLVRASHNSALRPAESIRLAQRIYAWRAALLRQNQDLSPGSALSRTAQTLRKPERT